MKTINDCIDSAVAQGFISKDEADTLKARYDALLKQTQDKAKVKDILVQELSAEALHKNYVAAKQEIARQAIDTDFNSYRNAFGEVDLPEALMQTVEADARSGTFVMDVDSKKLAIMRDIVRELDGFVQTFRRGWLKGDLRRQSKAVKMRIDRVVDALFGEKTDDAMANQFAEVVDKIREDLRIRHTEAGGMIGKLARYGMPMLWDGESIRNYIQRNGMDAMIDRVMKDGILDRDRMVNPLTGRKLTDAELREGAEVAFKRIMTDGWWDREPSGQPQGKGATWKQHADHRWFHFKDGKAWREIAEDFGNPDPYEAIMGGFAVMARDIAFMERFGPNAAMGFEYAVQKVRKAADTVLPSRTIYRSHAAKLKELSSQLTKPNPEYAELSDKLGAAHEQLAYLRSKYRPQLGGKPSKRDKVKIEALNKEVTDLIFKLVPYYRGDEPMVVADAEIARQMRDVMDQMGSEVTFAKAYNPQGYADHMIRRARETFDLHRGAMTGVQNNWAHVFSTARNVVTASSLGSAVLSAVSDPTFGKITRGMIGMSRSKASAVGILIRTLREALPSNRFDAMRLGVGLDQAIGSWHQEARYAGLVHGGQLLRPLREGFAAGSAGGAVTGLARAAERGSAFVADRVIALQGLNAWTQGGKNLAAKDIMGFFADQSTKPWHELGERTQQTLLRHGFDDLAWDKIRAAVPEDGFWITAKAVNTAAGRDLAERYAMMIIKETRAAVPEGTARTRSVIIGSTAKGSLSGELMRNFGQFKGFGFAVIFLQLRPILRELGINKARGAEYAAALLVTGALLGAVAIALKDIADGRDPRKVLDDETLVNPNFWLAAMAQAGGLGIYGDFLFADYNRFGGSLPATIAGPVWGRVDNLAKLTIGNIAQLRKGEPTNFNAEAVRFLRLNMPKVWYTRVFQDRAVDILQRMADPKAEQAFARIRSTRRKDFDGQEFWWGPGESKPSRPPDLMAPFRTR